MDKVFVNDLFVRIWQVFRGLYPDKKCSCVGAAPESSIQPSAVFPGEKLGRPSGAANLWVEELENGAYGMTIFPEDGETEPQVYVSADLPVKHAAEILAHELARRRDASAKQSRSRFCRKAKLGRPCRAANLVAAGEAADHGPAWEEAFDAIHRGYMGGQAAPQEHPKEFTLTIDRSEHIWLKAGILRAIQSDLEILEGLNRKKPRNVKLIRSNVEYLRGKLRLYDKLEAAAHPDERDNPMERYRVVKAMKKSANVCAFSGST